MVPLSSGKTRPVGYWDAPNGLPKQWKTRPLDTAMPLIATQAVEKDDPTYAVSLPTAVGIFLKDITLDPKQECFSLAPLVRECFKLAWPRHGCLRAVPAR